MKERKCLESYIFKGNKERQCYYERGKKQKGDAHAQPRGWGDFLKKVKSKTGRNLERFL